MNEELNKRLLEDLRKSGFESEMRAVQAIERSNWYCSSSSVYFDKDESITRSVDIHADIEKAAGGDVDGTHFSGIRYNLFIEVKKSEQPWIVFKRQASEHRDSHRFLQKTHQGITPNEITGHLAITFRANSLTKHLGWQGYGVHEAFKKPQDSGRWYSAAVSACKACSHYIGDDDPVVVDDHIFLDIAQPVVILDGPLFAAQVSNTGETELSQIQFAPFLFEFGTDKYKRRIYRVDLVSSSALPDYLDFYQKKVEAISIALEELAVVKQKKKTLLQ